MTNEMASYIEAKMLILFTDKLNEVLTTLISEKIYTQGEINQINSDKDAAFQMAIVAIDKLHELLGDNVSTLDISTEETTEEKSNNGNGND